MKVYLAIKVIPQKTSYRNEFILISSSKLEVAKKIYELGLDGHVASMYEYDTEQNKMQYIQWDRDPSFFVTVQNEIYEKDKKRTLRPEDV